MVRSGCRRSTTCTVLRWCTRPTRRAGRRNAKAFRRFHTIWDGLSATPTPTPPFCSGGYHAGVSRGRTYANGENNNNKTANGKERSGHPSAISTHPDTEVAIHGDFTGRHGSGYRSQRVARMLHPPSVRQCRSVLGMRHRTQRPSSGGGIFRSTE